MELASFILSVIALGVSLMALPTVFQMIWGAPKLAVSGGTHDAPEGVVYRIYVENEPIRSKWLRRLGIVRSSVEITGEFEIYERGTGRVVEGIRRAKFTSYKEKGFQVTVHRSYAPAFVNIIYQNPEGNCYVLAENGEDGTEILLGEYNIRIIIAENTDKTHTYTQFFRVGRNRHETLFLGDANGIKY